MKSELLLKIPGIIHGFGTRAQPLPELFTSFWDSRRPRWKQNHGVQSIEVTHAQQECGEVDALTSAVPHIPIAVMTADCVPVLMARTDGKRVAAIHAGWRGTEARILELLCQKLRSEGEDLTLWNAAIGPAIGPCCYEVSPELAQNFSKSFPAQVHGRHLDLPAMNAEQLKHQVVLGVEIIRACTRCSKTPEGSPEFFSYRREGSGTRQWSVISIS